MTSASAIPAPGASSIGLMPDRITTPPTLAAFITDASRSHQPTLVLIAMVLFVADLAPLELQRRIVNAAFPGGSVRSIAALAMLYIVAALAMGALKLGLNVYRSYVSESAVRRLRKMLLGDFGYLAPEHRAEVEGVEVSLILAEAEPVGAFVGISVSEPVLQGGIVAGTFAYMLYLNPLMALLALAVFTPQMIFVPLMQRAINQRVVTRTGALRRISGGIIGNHHLKPSRLQAARIDRVFQLNMGIFQLKFSMNFLMNLMHHLGIGLTLGVGGYLVVKGATELGTVVAVVAGLKQLNDPWKGLIDWFRELRVTQAKYALLRQALDTLSRRHPRRSPVAEVADPALGS
ncbi:ABC transporter ATP-binding protein [Methylobacterium sp. P5_C11]